MLISGERLWTDLRDGMRWSITWRQVADDGPSSGGSCALTFLSGDGTSFDVLAPTDVAIGIETLSDAEFRIWLSRARGPTNPSVH